MKRRDFFGSTRWPLERYLNPSLTKDKVMELKMFVNIEDLFYNDINDPEDSC